MADPTPTYYAWSQIITERDEHGMNRKIIQPGEKVTAESTKVTKEQFQEWIDTGVVRTLEFPKMPDTWTGSPVEWYRELAAQAANEASMQVTQVQDEQRANAPAVGTTGT